MTMLSNYNDVDNLTYRQRAVVARNDLFYLERDLKEYRNCLTRMALVSMLHYKQWLEDHIAMLEHEE